MDWQERIEVESLSCGGRAWIRGTRIPVADVVNKLCTGISHAEILQTFPTLTIKDIEATLSYMASAT